jgi:hypothetical protein
MRGFRANSGVKTKLAALAAVGACFATVTAPAMALNPQPLPPRAAPVLVVAPPGLIGGLTCHEYGCL